MGYHEMGHCRRQGGGIVKPNWSTRAANFGRRWRLGSQEYWLTKRVCESCKILQVWDPVSQSQYFSNPKSKPSTVSAPPNARHMPAYSCTPHTGQYKVTTQRTTDVNITSHYQFGGFVKDCGVLWEQVYGSVSPPSVVSSAIAGSRA